MKNKKIVVVGLVIIAVVIIVLVYMNVSSVSLTDGSQTINDAVSTTTTQQHAAVPVETLKKQSNSYLGRDGVYVVQYTDNGFVPRELQIPKGKSVRFINVSSKGMRVYSDITSDPKFVELNEAKTIGKGGTYTFSFVIEGLWAYHNEVNSAHGANIIVY